MECMAYLFKLMLAELRLLGSSGVHRIRCRRSSCYNSIGTHWTVFVCGEGEEKEGGRRERREVVREVERERETLCEYK